MSNFALKQRLHFAEYPDGALHIVRLNHHWANGLCDTDEVAALCTFPDGLGAGAIVCHKCIDAMAQELADHQTMLAEAINVTI